MSKKSLFPFRRGELSPKAIINYFLQNKLALIGAIVVAIILIVLLSSLFSSPPTDIPTYKVKRDNFLVSITESGEIEAVNAVSVSAPRIRGNLKIVYLVPQGTYVQPGDTVCQFDPTEALSNLKENEAALELAISEKQKLNATQKSSMTRLESDLKSSELSFELSKLNMEQMKFEAEMKQQQAKLEHQRNELSYKKSLQEYESQKIIQESERNKMDIEIMQKRNEVERSKRDLGMLTLTAPKEGLVVYERNWQTGRKMAVGDTPWGGMPVISLPDLSAMQSKTFVNEVDVSRVSVGQKVRVKLDAFQDSTFLGSIEDVASLGQNKDRRGSIKVFEIIVAIESQSTILKPGMTTSNQMIINEIPDVIFVPQESIFKRDDESIIFVKNGSGFDERVVVLGEKSEDYVVIEEGLDEGEVVALRDPTIEIDEESDQSGGTKSAPGMSS